MRNKALLLVACLIMLAGGLSGEAKDGSVPWPVTTPTGEVEALPFWVDPVLCAFNCGSDNCDFDGTFLGAICSGGEVLHYYWMCVLSSGWNPLTPCECDTVIEHTGIPCTPGDPIPEAVLHPGHSGNRTDPEETINEL